MFKDVVIPPLPAAVSRLLAEINSTDPAMDRLGTMISADPEIAANVLRTVNSSLFALKHPVQNIVHAISLLGIERIRSLVLSYAMLKALPAPKGNLFDHEAYWTDSLLRALLARRLCLGSHQGQEEIAFTAALLADLALPVLLSSWSRYYEPVVERWAAAPDRLSDIERDDFGWDHAQAGAWILQHWDFPPETLCIAGAHNLAPEQLRDLDLADTAALPVATAAILPSVLKPAPDRCRLLVLSAAAELSLPNGDWPEIVAQIREDFATICGQFHLSSNRADEVLTLLAEAAAATESTSDDVVES